MYCRPRATAARLRVGGVSCGYRATCRCGHCECVDVFLYADAVDGVADRLKTFQVASLANL